MRHAFLVTVLTDGREPYSFHIVRRSTSSGSQAADEQPSRTVPPGEESGCDYTDRDEGVEPGSQVRGTPPVARSVRRSMRGDGRGTGQTAAANPSAVLLSTSVPPQVPSEVRTSMIQERNPVLGYEAAVPEPLRAQIRARTAAVSRW
jgi:hypothetical protein